MIIFEHLISAAVTLLAAFLGAYFAFKFQNNKEEKSVKERSLTAGNLAIYKVGRMSVALYNFEKDFVQPVRKDPLAFITLKSSQPTAVDWDGIDYVSLAFLFSLNHKNVIVELTGVENNFQAFFQDIDIRSKLKENEVYNALKSAGLANKTTPPSIEELKEALGPKLFQTMQESTNRIISMADSLQSDLGNVQDKLILVLEKAFPGATVIRYKPAKPGD